MKSLDQTHYRKFKKKDKPCVNYKKVKHMENKYCFHGCMKREEPQKSGKQINTSAYLIFRVIEPVILESNFSSQMTFLYNEKYAK